MKIHHFGYLVKDLKKARDVFLGIGYSECAAPFDGITHDEYREILISFIERDGYILELIAPIGRESKMYPLLKKQRNTAYHICYESQDIDADINCLANMGWSVIDGLAPAPAFGNRNVCFMLHPAAGITEIVDMKGVSP